MKKMFPSILALIFFSGCAATSSGPQLQNGQVRFALHAPSAESVAVTGSFNRWDSRGQALSGPDRSGVWSVTLPLPPGRYEYAFIIDGTVWQTDPGAPFMDDGFGGRNSVVEVR
jgi:1,4-alpha-glucan branching enzyme